MLTNPFTDENFAQFQISSKKATKLFVLSKDNFAYIYPLYQKYNLLYATKYSNKLKKIAEENNAIYTLIESYEEIKNPTKNPLKQIIPRHTIIIDLKQSAEEMLNKMHPKGRYNIKLSERKGIQIKQSTDITEFYQILEDTAKRDGFAINSFDYYQQFLTQLGNKAKLFMAYYNDKPIAGILNGYFNKTAIYYYGASSNEHRNLMAPYLLQWHAIQDAKNNKFTHYDLLGIADPSNPKDPLQGVTYFKQKFGGTPHTWPASRIIINKPIFYFALKIRKFFQRISA